MPDTQTLPNSFSPLEHYIDGLSNGEATLLGILLTLVISISVWAINRYRKGVSMTNLHPHLPTSVSNERRERLETKLKLLYEQYDLETRVEEKLRLKALIEQTKKDLESV